MCTGITNLNGPPSLNPPLLGNFETNKELFTVVSMILFSLLNIHVCFFVYFEENKTKNKHTNKQTKSNLKADTSLFWKTEQVV